LIRPFRTVRDTRLHTGGCYPQAKLAGRGLVPTFPFSLGSGSYLALQCLRGRGTL